LPQELRQAHLVKLLPPYLCSLDAIALLHLLKLAFGRDILAGKKEQPRLRNSQTGSGL